MFWRKKKEVCEGHKDKVNPYKECVECGHLYKSGGKTVDSFFEASYGFRVNDKRENYCSLHIPAWDYSRVEMRYRGNRVYGGIAYPRSEKIYYKKQEDLEVTKEGKPIKRSSN